MTDTPTSDEEGVDEEQAAIAMQRAEEYVSYGIPKTHAKAGALRDLGIRNKDVAEFLSVSGRTAGGYYTKFNTNRNEALLTFLSTFGGPCRILAKQEIDGDNRENIRVIAASLDQHNNSSEQVYQDPIDPESVKVTLYTIQTGGPSGEPSGRISVNTESFNSLRALADEKYSKENSDFGMARAWYNLLGEAGGEQFKQTLTPPGETLPAGHPDSADHFQHQMQSLEPDGVDQPRHPDDPHGR